VYKERENWKRSTKLGERRWKRKIAFSQGSGRERREGLRSAKEIEDGRGER